MSGLFIALAVRPLLAARKARGFRTAGGKTAGEIKDQNHAGTVDVVSTRTVSLRVERGTEADSPNPLSRKSWFSGLLSRLCASGFHGLLSGRARRRDTRRERRALLAEMDRALTEVDTEAFFRASRQLVRSQLAGRFNLVADAIAADDARKHVSEPDLPEVLDVADCIIYSGRTLSQEDLAFWHDRILADIRRFGGRSSPAAPR